MTCADAGRIGAARKHQFEREPILRKCRDMREAMKMAPHRGLVPVLILTSGDRL